MVPEDISFAMVIACVHALYHMAKERFSTLLVAFSQTCKIFVKKMQRLFGYLLNGNKNPLRSNSYIYKIVRFAWPKKKDVDFNLMF